MLSSYGSWPTPCPAGWARTICFDCRSGCVLLPTKVQRFTRHYQRVGRHNCQDDWVFGSGCG